MHLVSRGTGTSWETGRRARRAAIALGRRAAWASGLSWALIFAPPAYADDVYPLYLSPVVDGVAKPGVIVVLPGKNGVLVTPAALKAIGISPRAGQAQKSGKRFFPKSGRVSAAVNIASQVIRFTVPNADLLSTVTTVSAPTLTLPTRSATGVFLNYAFSLIPPTGTGVNRTQLQFAGNLVGVLFSPYGFLSSGELLQVPRVAGSFQPIFTRLNTTYELDQPQIPLAIRAGDLVTYPPGWSRAVFLGGLQFATDYQLQPNRVTFPTPIIGQTLAQPSDISLLVNNVAAYQGNTDAGPFSLVGIPVVNGLNQVTIQTRSAAGTVSSQTVPFYASGTMLAAGLTDYNVSAGFIRHHYGQINNAYSTPVFDGTFNAGLTNYLTATFHAEAAPNLGVLGAGAETSGFWGDLAAAFAVSAHGAEDGIPAQTGRLYSVQYTRSAPDFGIAAGLIDATSGFDDLGLESGSTYPELNWHASLSGQMPFSAGSISVAYTVQSQARHNRDAFLLGTYSKQIRGRLSLTISCFKGAIRAFGASTPDAGCDAGLSLALGPTNSIGASAAFGSGQVPEWGETFQDFPSGVTGLGGSAGNYMGNYVSRSIRLQDISRYADMSADIAQNGDSRSAEFGLAGTVVLMDGLYFSRPANNAFAVVDFGYPKVPVFLSNQIVGVTGAGGKLLIPSLVPNYGNQISLDPTKLPLNVTFQNEEVTVTPPSEGGVYVKFPVRRLDAVLLTIKFKRGGHPPAGSLLYLQGSQTPIVVGYDGYVYIQDPPLHIAGTVIMSTGHCVLDTTVAISIHNAVVGRPVTCVK